MQGKREHIDMRKFLDWAMYKDVGVTTDSETGDVERKGARRPGLPSEKNLDS